MNRRLYILLLVSLFLILIGSLIAWYAHTDGGNIKIVDVRFVGSNGIPMSGLLYIPPNATAQTPAPGIVAIHGYINSRETQDGFAIEFARRGFVVLASDQTGHGFSGPPAFANGFGGPDALKFLLSLDIVDPENVGLEGHSMGGWAVQVAAMIFPDAYKAMVLEGSSPGTFGAPEGTADTPRNTALVFSKYDEFSLLMWGSPTASGIKQTDKLKTFFGTTDIVEEGRIYGSIENGTGRVLYQPAITHPMDHINTTAIGHAVDWFNQTLVGGNGLPASNQIWYWKEIGTLIALIGLIMSFFPIGGLLLETNAFRELQEPLPEAKPAVGWGWWLAALLTIAIPALTYFRLNNLVGAENYQASALFPQNITTGIMFWALGNGLITLVLFLLWHFLLNRRSGASFVNYGIAWVRGIDWGRIVKSFLLAALIALFGYLLLALADFLFKVDFRFWVVALKPMSAIHFRIFLGYLIPFAIYFLILAMALHGQLRQVKADGQPVSLRRAMLVNVLLMVAGLVILLLWQYIPLFAGRPLGNAEVPESLLAIVAIQFVVILGIVALISTYFFRKTGHIYVGAFLNAIFVTWYIVAGQAIHFPL